MTRMTTMQFRKAAAALNLSYNQIAGRLNIRPDTVRKWATGDKIPHKIRTELEAIAAKLGISIEHVFWEDTYLDLDHAAHHLNIFPATLFDLCVSGEGPHCDRVTDRQWWHPTTLDTWRDENRAIWDAAVTQKETMLRSLRENYERLTTPARPSKTSLRAAEEDTPTSEPEAPSEEPSVRLAGIYPGGADLIVNGRKVADLIHFGTKITATSQQSPHMADAELDNPRSRAWGAAPTASRALSMGLDEQQMAECVAFGSTRQGAAQAFVSWMRREG